ncbi:VacJ family lipoprotein [Rhodospirillaceae bacterium KN72]|uniref:VacJ family lipoprotein n=1 Tax=Pacificispira spongiicola TaxID=2729598 RepID=A0A7Y0DY77_9PROT|nr:VacJ family lipoprotein [Pacificispira spongiicola]NMM43802.1 VacJ family lipoprotein [Pacificispira spongiicola]
MSDFRRFINCLRSLAATLILCGAVAACATAPTDPVEREIYEEANDPAQPLNEAIFEFNLALDKAVLRPVAKAYEFALPDLVRDGVRNFLRYLKTPVILANDLMQGEVERAGDTLGRFLFNTIGGFGVFDVAGSGGLEYHEEDFGQTLAVWGVGEGPYLMLPFLGPSSGRDLAGFIVDSGLDPFRWWGYNSDRPVIENNTFIRAGAEAIDTRSRNYKQLEDLEETSLDFYATVRSLYRQQRNSLIRNGADADEAIPDMSFDDADMDVLDTVSDASGTLPANTVAD